MNYGKRGVKHRQNYINPVSGKLGKKLFLTCVKLVLVFVLIIAVTVTCAGVGMVKGIIDTAPEISLIDVSPTGYKTYIYDKDGNISEELVGSESNRVYVTIDKIPLTLQHAFVAIEDERFYQHNGIDPKGIMRAAYIAISRGSLDQGASTITQQLIKNNVFNAFNEDTSEKIKRKIREQYLALKLEETLTKDEILENYLNTINLGNGNFGVQAAANNYFDKDVSELTISECAVIAGITQRPEGLNPVRFPERNAERRKEVLKKMYKQEYISKEEYEEALADDVYSRIKNIHAEAETTNVYSYFVDELIQQVKTDLMTQKGYTETQANNLIYKGGLKIMSTQDLKIQAIMDEEFVKEENFPKSTKVSIEYSLVVTEPDGIRHNYNDTSLQYYFINKTGNKSFTKVFNSKEIADQYIAEFKAAKLENGGTVTSEKLTYIMQPQASMSIIDQSTGHVVALAGGRGEKTANLTFNRATDSTRQPGSTFKIIAAYAPAIDLGQITLATAIDDSPYRYSNGSLVRNYDRLYLGLISVRNAIRDSRNIPAIKTLAAISPKIGFTYAQNFGFSTLISPDKMVNGNHDMVESLSLGGITKGVTNVDLCAAYATIANDGIYNEPIYYTQVYDHDGNLILDNSLENTSHRVIKESTADIITSALVSVTTSGTGTGTNFRTQPIAGKTGTTTSDVDKWFVGYTPYYTAAVWLGYDDNTPCSNSTHTKLWRKVMERVHEGLERKEFSMGKNIVSLEVCSQSGKLVSEGLCDCDPRGSQVVTEYFIKGTEPTEFCDVHVKATLCNATNDLASEHCPTTYEKIFIVKNECNLINELTEPEDLLTKIGDQEYVLSEDLTECTTHTEHITDNPNDDDDEYIGDNEQDDDSSTDSDTDTNEEETSSTKPTKPSKPTDDTKHPTP